MGEVLLGYGVDFEAENNFGKVRGKEGKKGKEGRGGGGEGGRGKRGEREC